MNRLLAAGGREYRITEALEKLAGHVAQAGLVFHQKNCLVAIADNSLSQNLGAFRRRIDGGQVYLERASLSDFAVNPNVPIILLDDAIDRRKAEAGSLPYFLGLEERVKKMALGGLGHSRARVG